MSDNKSRISRLKEVLGTVSSSDLCGCSVSVHGNALIADLFVDGRFRSDLEFALVDKDAQALNSIVQSERSPRYSDVSFPRHMSSSDYSDIIEASTNDLDNLVKSSTVSPAAPADSASSASSAAPVTPAS